MSESEGLILALDFDGTICQHAKHPDIGPPVPHALKWITRFHAAGAKSFLWTCRHGPALDKAVSYLDSVGIDVHGVNHYEYWDGFQTSRKLFANIYVDDAAACAPLVSTLRPGAMDPTDFGRPYLDWERVGPMIWDRIKTGKLHA